MKSVWKYPLQAKERQKIVVPIGARFLDVQLQNDVVTLWALVDTRLGVEQVQRDVFIVGTGFSAPEVVVEYLATVQQGSSVWHVFVGGIEWRK